MLWRRAWFLLETSQLQHFLHDLHRIFASKFEVCGIGRSESWQPWYINNFVTLMNSWGHGYGGIFYEILLTSEREIRCQRCSQWEDDKMIDYPENFWGSRCGQTFWGWFSTWSIIAIIGVIIVVVIVIFIHYSFALEHFPRRIAMMSSLLIF